MKTDKPDITAPAGVPKVLICFGTMPEAVKMCPPVLAFRGCRDLETVVCSTGQHREMLDCALRSFGVVPDVDLSVMREAQTPGDVAAAVSSAFGDLLEKVKPDIVLVHGDTVSAYACAVRAYLDGIPVAHIEAGLRTYAGVPFPEEFCRREIDGVSCLHFAPTPAAVSNLRSEGYPEEGIILTGNTSVDALRLTLGKTSRNGSPDGFFEAEAEGEEKEKGKGKGEKLILISSHRREILGGRQRALFAALRRVIESFPGVRAVYLTHLNPEVMAAAEVFRGSGRITEAGPLTPAECHRLLSRCSLCVTDSGGLTEESLTLGVPVVMLRDVTERPEGLDTGAALLAGTEPSGAAEKIAELLRSPARYEAARAAALCCSSPQVRAIARGVPEGDTGACVTGASVYGDGYASERILAAVRAYLGARRRPDGQILSL